MNNGQLLERLRRSRYETASARAVLESSVDVRASVNALIDLTARDSWNAAMREVERWLTEGEL